MNNLAYSTQKPDEVANKIEEILRKDLGLTQPINFKIEEEEKLESDMKAMVKDGLTYLFGGNKTILFTVVFEITEPKPATIYVRVDRQGAIGCHAGTIIFSTTVAKTIKSDVGFEEPKTFGTSKFTGDTDAISKLNSNKDLLKMVDKFARVKSDIGKITIPRFCKIMPSNNGSHLIINTLGRPVSMGFSATTDAKMFFDIANLIDTVL